MLDNIKTGFSTKGGVFTCIPARYVVATMCFIGVTLQYAMKVFLSVAIVAMVKSSANATEESVSKSMHEDVCPRKTAASNSTNQDGEFDWDGQMEGYVLSSYYYGYIATQLLAGRMSELFGSKIVLGPGVFAAGLFTLLGPVTAHVHVSFFMISRILVGAASGLIIPAVNNILPKWFVPQEMFFIGAAIMAGIPIGIIIAMTVSGVIADAGGWPPVFYFFGGAGVLFMIPWYFLAFDVPDKHPRISEEEKNFILNGIESNKANTETKMSYPVPWLAVLFSWPVWVHNIMGMGYGWVSFTLLSELPIYLNQILHYNIQNSGLISSLPYIASGVSTVLSSYISQKLREKNYLSHIMVYRIFNTISGVGSGLCLLLITFADCNDTVIVILLICALGLAGFYLGGSFLSHVNLGKNFTGTLAGIYLTTYNLMGVVTPSIAGAIVSDQHSLNQWKLVFYIGAAVPVATSLLYLVFGTAEEQHWNKVSSETDKKPQDVKDA